MATYAPERIRKGLPRTPGGSAWPDVDGAVLAAPSASLSAEDGAAATVAVEARIVAAPVVETSVPAVSTPAGAVQAESAKPAATDAPAASAPAAEKASVALRQGLPRVPGGEPWPAGGTAAVPVAAVAANAVSTPIEAAAASEAVSTAPTVAAAAQAPAPEGAEAVDLAPSALADAVTAAAFDTVSEELALRQGLPRVTGGDPWPPAGAVTVERAIASLPASSPAAEAAAAPTAVAAPVVPAAAEPAAISASVAPAEVVAPTIPSEARAANAAAESSAQGPAKPAPASAAAPKLEKAPKSKREPIVVKGRTLAQWAKLAVLWGGGAIFAAAVIVLAARGLTTFQVVRDFLERYPGEYELPEFVDPGFPAWARWSHFLNFFLMVLIIRSGLLVRQQQKPDAFFTPKKGGKKISIYLWLHTSLDLLWLLNGVVFVVLLFASGHWARIVPTSWEVFPNALSAGIQYLTLEWPHEDGWVNYNSLQQIMYFTVVFIAAPLAAITGVRMSEWWPKDAEKLNRLYPAPVARAIHFPVMLFFVLFIIIHVFLVFTTGALKNLNHMFVGTPEPSWLGFWLFAAGLFVTVGVTWAARPLVLAPIAGAFGRVSER